MKQNKNYHLVLVYVILALFLKSESCYSQHTVDLSNISLIVYNKNDTDLRFFEENNKGLYTEMYLEFEDSYKDIFLLTDIKQKNDVCTLEEIKLNKNEVLIHKNNLRETNIKNLLNNEFEIKNNSFKGEEKTKKFALKFLNKSLSVIQELQFKKQEYSGGLGSIQIHRRNDDENKWRVHDAGYFNVIDLNLGNNKHIYLLIDGKYPGFIYLPLTDNDFLISLDGISTIKNSSLYKTNYLKTFSRYEYEYFVTLLRNKKNKYELVNTFKENVLKREYDTIMYNQFFIIGKNKKQIDIFNSYYEKIKIDSIKSAYLYRSGLEILNHKGANYYDSELKIIENFPGRTYTLCGTVSYQSHSIAYDKFFKSYILTRKEGEAFSNQGKRKDFILEGIKKRDKVTFLNNRNEVWWDGNSEFTNQNYINPNYLIVTRGNRSGIYKYHYYIDYENDTIADMSDSFLYFPEAIENEVILPIKYKSIKYNIKDGLVYFYRKNKVGIFPRHKTVQFDDIEQKTNSFYSITKDKKRGWLDIKTNIEYYEN